MNLKKLIILSIIAMFLLIPMAYGEESTDYSIFSVVRNINISEDGTVNVREDVNYTFDETLAFACRIIPLCSTQSVSDISVETPGFYNRVEVENASNQSKIKVYLYKDKELTQPISAKNALVTYHYNLNEKLKSYNDVVEFRYMQWGSEWEKGVYKLKTNVTIPGNFTAAEVWNNPPYMLIDSSLLTLEKYETNYKIIDAGVTVEQRILMPKEYFNSTDNMEVINQDAKQVIEQSQSEYYDSITRNIFISYILLGIGVVLIASPGIIYYKWIREPKVAYDKKYETSPPTDDAPLFVNGLVKDSRGVIDVDGFYATILDLANRHFIKFEDKLHLTLNRNSDLENYEKMIMDYLAKFGDGEGNISIEDIGRESPSEFNKFFENWKTSADGVLDYTSHFHFRGVRYSLIYVIVALVFIVTSLILMKFVLIPYVPIEDWVFRAVVVLIVESIIMFRLHRTINGQWSRKGKIFYDRWKSFEYYINDYTLIRKYPPESVKMWNKCIVYATALGDIRVLDKIMKKCYEESVSEDDKTALSNMGDYMALYDAFAGLTV